MYDAWWWEYYHFYLKFESELKYYLPNVNWVLAISFMLLLMLLVALVEKTTQSTKSLVFLLVYSALTAGYFTFILSVTLFGREPISHSSWSTLFISYEYAIICVPGARMAIFFNIVLFIPLGILLSRYKNNKICVLVVFVLPLLIEFIQLIASLGVFEFSDIINNFIGGLIGLGIARLTAKLYRLIKDRIGKRKGGRVERAE